MKIAILLALFAVSNSTFAKTSAVLGSVEKHYRETSTIKMNVTKVLKLQLLDREKKSEGVIQIKKGGYLRWETETPEHSIVVSDGKAIWLVDYMANEDEKPNIIKAVNPKRSQPHAVVALLLGGGKVSDDFKVSSEKSTDNSHAELKLKPKHDADQLKWLNLVVNKEKLEIEKASFEDTLGNVTELRFKDIVFGEKIDSKVFSYTPPKGADVTVLK